MEEQGYIIIMEDGIPYHKGYAIVHRKQLKKNKWIS
jgi:hypothetical protein